MTREEQIVMLNILNDKVETEGVLSAFLDLAGEAIINRVYPYADDEEELEVPKKYHRKQVEIAAYLMTRRGAEGQKQHSENGVDIAYDSGAVPDDMLSDIVPKVGVIK